MVISSFPDLKAMLHTLPPKPAVVAAAAAATSAAAFLSASAFSAAARSASVDMVMTKVMRT